MKVSVMVGEAVKLADTVLVRVVEGVAERLKVGVALWLSVRVAEAVLVRVKDGVGLAVTEDEGE